jgi:cytochrome b561
MAVSWGILVPLAIGSSLLRDTLPPGVWLKIHFSLNMFAIVCMAAGFGIAVYASNKKTADAEDAKHHSTIGVVICLLAIMQAIVGMMRPHADAEDAKHHSTIGVVICLLAIMQAIVGMMRPQGPKPATPEELPNDIEGASESGSKETGKSIARRIWEYKHRILGLQFTGLVLV